MDARRKDMYDAEKKETRKENERLLEGHQEPR
jgi:hypothetical protein